MPKMTGIHLSKKILKIRPDIPIILCTGFSNTTQYEAATALGIREIVFKPIIWKDLATLIRKIFKELKKADTVN